MSTYRASVHVEGGMLHTARPLTAPDVVGELFDRVVYAVSLSDGRLTAVELTFDTSADSDTPVGDTAVGTSSTLLGDPPGDPDPDGADDVVPMLVPAPQP